MSEPTDEEKRLIKEFRLKVSDVLKDDEQRSDPYLLRWIRARDNNLEKAEGILRTHLKWREETGADNALTDKRDEFFETNFPYFIKGRDKDGHPIVEMPFGSWDLRKVGQQENGEQRFARYSTKMFEEMLEAIRISNKGKDAGTWPNTQIFMLGDWTGFSYSQLLSLKAVQSLLSMASKYEAHYPEILYKGMCINCPAFFPMLWNMVKGLLAAKTVGKIQLFGTDRKVWSSEVLDEIDPDQLAVQFGGICLDREIKI